MIRALFLALLLLATSAHAETISATNITTTSYKSTVTGATGSSISATACKVTGSIIWATTVASSYAPSVCTTGLNCSQCSYNGGGTSLWYDGIQTVAPHYECPTGGNWTLSGTSCSRPDCAAGQVRNASGVCEVPCPAAGTRLGSLEAGAGSVHTFQGCGISCGFQINSGSFWVGTNCKSTGAKDSTGVDASVAPATPPKVVAPSDCLLAGQGYVTSSTGTTSCVSASNSPNPVTVTTLKNSSSTVTPPTGTPQTTNNKITDTINYGTDGAAVTRTVETTAPDGTKTTSSNTAPLSTFCESNPSASICNTDPCAGSKTIGCQEFGDPVDGDPLTTKEIGVSSITPVAFASNASCPADIPLPKGAVFSFKWPCDMATSLRPILLALAWLAAGLIVIGAAKEST